MEVANEKLKLICGKALQNLNEEERELTAVEKTALEILVPIIVSESTGEVTEDYITDQLNQIISRTAIEELCELGYLETVVDEQGDFLFRATDKGKRWVQESS